MTDDLSAPQTAQDPTAATFPHEAAVGPGRLVGPTAPAIEGDTQRRARPPLSLQELIDRKRAVQAAAWLV